MKTDHLAEMSVAAEKYEALEKLYNELKTHYSQILSQGGESLLGSLIQNISVIENRKDQFSFSEKTNLMEKFEGSEKASSD